MAKTRVVITAAVKTPLYLPLYVAQRNQFFGLLRDYSLEIEYAPEGTRDADGWAVRRLETGSNESVCFAVCDPLKAYGSQNARVIAALVHRAAFWAVDRNKIVRRLDDFERFRQIICYPEDMSGYWLAKLAEQAAQKEGMIREVDFGTELDELVTSKDAVAITVNLLAAIQLKAKNREVDIAYSWSQHPAGSMFMLTGLLTTEDVETASPALVDVMLEVFQRSIELIGQGQEAVVTLKKEFGASDAEAAEVVGRFLREEIYPRTIIPELMQWSNALAVYRISGRPATQEEVQNSFLLHVRQVRARRVVDRMIDRTKMAFVGPVDAEGIGAIPENELDDLLPIGRRKIFDLELERFFEQSVAAQEPLSFLMIDIDHFKQVNDTYGHQCGDDVLKACAKLIAARIKGKGRAYRYGGEEIAVLLPNFEPAESVAIAESLRRSIAQLAVGEKTIHVTASIGVACRPDHAGDRTELCRVADLAMYDAKASGRNRVHEAPRKGDPGLEPSS